MPMDPAPAPPEPSQSSGPSPSIFGGLAHALHWFRRLVNSTLRLLISKSHRLGDRKELSRLGSRRFMAALPGVGHHKTTRKSTSRDAYFANRTKRPQSKLRKVSARTDSDLIKASLTGFLTRAKPAAEELFCQLTLRAPWNPAENGK